MLSTDLQLAMLSYSYRRAPQIPCPGAPPPPPIILNVNQVDIIKSQHASGAKQIISYDVYPSFTYSLSECVER